MIGMGDTTTIPLTRETRNLLKKRGRKGETYDELILRLIEMAEQVEFAESLKRILAEEDFTPLDEA